MFLVAIFFLFLYKIAPSASTTHEDGYFPGHVEEIIFNVDWMTCLTACHDKPTCISYNYCKENMTCEMNSNGIKPEQCKSKSVIYLRGWIFHQIRPVPEEIHVPELGDDPSRPAKSCKQILTERGNVGNSAYYIGTESENSLVYCQMESIAECGGEGGWTLAMKINGSKGTFSFNSPLWTNKDVYNPEEAKDLSDTEAKSAAFSALLNVESLCVGMKVNGHIKWLKIPITKNGASVQGIFIGDTYENINIDLSKWKSLISESSIHDGNVCSRSEGFNVRPGSSANGAKARIGLVGFKTCGSGDPVSRIGFGTEGGSGGMDSNNTCGNEATAVAVNGFKSIKAFCYILIK
ncbi:hypothetical protein OS493_034551 [Desmophyllum pertusum]|uniref:Apple domain-containing protein n=1 Tax=Desmophyllum pertusum TaxID=174260 RepID=A0A9W9YB06_9CNID|nr:hypothetical protein OS493_034551 [Desmophyllum pertusum]